MPCFQRLTWNFQGESSGNHGEKSSQHFTLVSLIGEARQLLLRGPIEGALAHGDGTTLSELASAHPTGFRIVLEDCVPAGEQAWSALAPSDLAKAATALTNSGVLVRTESRPEAVAIRASILNAVVQVTAWSPFDAVNAKGMVAIVQLVGDPERVIPALLEGTSNAPVEVVEEASTLYN